MRRHRWAFAVVFGAAALAASVHAEAAVTKGPWVQRVTRTSAVVRVEVDPPSAVTLETVTPTAPDGAAPSILESASATLHAFTLTDLEPAKRYAYAIRVAGVAKHASFTTAPAEDTPFRFLVYGDNRTDDTAHAAVVRAMTATPSDFLVHTGDFVDHGGSSAHWQTFFDVEAPLLRERCIFSAVGNHELVDGAGIQYVRYFGATAPDAAGQLAKAMKPEHLNGTFRWSNTRFFLLNGMVGYRGTADREWLEKALAASDAEPGLVWRVVVVHHGPWSSGPHGNNARLHDADVPALLRAHKVDAVLSGHDHIYERGSENGIAYVVTGGGGAPTYKIKNVLPSAKKLESVRHFVDVSVGPTAMQFVAHRVDGSTIERCSLQKGTGWDCDGATEATGSTPAGAAPSPNSTAPVASRCACRSAGVDASGDVRPLAGLALSALLLLWRRRSRALVTSGRGV